TKIYPVAHLLASDPEFTEEHLAEAVELVAGDVQVLPGALAITRPERVHDEVAQLLDAIGRAGDESPLPLREPSPAEAAITRALAQPTRFEFTDTPLSQALAELSQRYQINIALDQKRMEDS